MPSPIRVSFHVAVLALSAALLLLGAPQARADALGDAKAAGQVGEQTDGYLGLVDQSAPAEVKAMVADINSRRREKYQAIAEKTGTSLEAVAERAGVKLLQRAKPGHFVQDAKGGWVRK
jgi:uncharacterized protein YdbL (DUF1318 family)